MSKLKHLALVTTSAIADGGGYVRLPEVVRDFYSREVFWKAQPRLRFLQFTKVRRDLQANRGKSIVFVKYDNLEGGGPIEEHETVVPDSLSASEVTITVKEQVKAVQISEFLLTVSLMNQLEDASQQLANNFAKVLDGQLRDAALSTTNVVYGNEVANIGAMSGTSKLNAKTIRAAVEILATNNAPKINGEYYVCFAHPHQLRQLREDPEWLEGHKYMGRRQLYLGEVGMYEGVIFIDTTQMPKLLAADINTKYGGTYTAGTHGYEAVIIGENTIAWGIALDVELRDDGVVDIGRKHTLAWYGIWGTGLLEPDYAVRILTV